MFISSYQRDHFLKMCGNQYSPESQAFRNFCIWHRPAARSALPPRRPPWQIPPFAPCVALRLLHKQLGEKELPSPSRPSTYKGPPPPRRRTIPVVRASRLEINLATRSGTIDGKYWSSVERNIWCWKFSRGKPARLWRVSRS